MGEDSRRKEDAYRFGRVHVENNFSGL